MYDRAKNASRETIQEGEPAYIGMDFNVRHMAAIIHVKRDGLPHAVGEIIDGYDTPDMVKQLRRKLGQRPIRIYPDASGKNPHSTDANASDH